mmetsp:Transcript_33110/g.87414  ORF Transcript_33110/g.87414 Transcript_33110/m.87414 type:complete len:152 (+) Transcript_33110:367-822(+)
MSFPLTPILIKSQCPKYLLLTPSLQKGDLHAQGQPLCLSWSERKDEIPYLHADVHRELLGTEGDQVWYCHQLRRHAKAAHRVSQLRVVVHDQAYLGFVIVVMVVVAMSVPNRCDRCGSQLTSASNEGPNGEWLISSAPPGRPAGGVGGGRK